MPPRKVREQPSRKRTRSPLPVCPSGSELEVQGDYKPGVEYTEAFWKWSNSPFDRHGIQPYPKGVRIHVLLSLDGIAELLNTALIKMIDDDVPNMPYGKGGLELGSHDFKVKTFKEDKVNTKKLLSGEYHVVGSHALKIVAGWDEKTQESRHWMPFTLKTQSANSFDEDFYYFVIPVPPNEGIYTVG